MTLSRLKPPKDAYGIKKILNIADYSILCDFVDLCGIDQSIKKTAKDIIDSGEAYKISQLSLSGSDILSLGYSGAQVGEKLELLLKQVMLDPRLTQKKNSQSF